MSELELIELKYFYAKGYRYIARNEKGNVKIFKKQPIRHKWCSCYGIWIIQDNYPIKMFSEYGEVELGRYDFIKWEDEAKLIENLIK